MTLQGSTDSGMERVLDDQIRIAEAMLGTLDSENKALLDNDVDALSLAGSDKARLLQTLEGLERDRREIAARLRLSPEGGPGGSRWQHLLELMQECRQRNQSNGALVKVRRDQLLQVMKIVSSHQVELYDAKGAGPGLTAIHPLGRA